MLKRLAGLVSAFLFVASAASAQVPYTFANQNGFVSAAQLDANFNYSTNFAPGWTGASTTTILARLKNQVFLSDFNPHLDGVTDDSPALQACVYAAANGVCVLPSYNFTMAIATTIVINNNALILGWNKGGYSFVSPPNAFWGCRMLWTGTTGGTMLAFGPTAGMTTYNTGGGIKGCMLDGINDPNGNTSTSGGGIAISIQSVHQAVFDVAARFWQTAAIDMRTTSVAITDVTDTQENYIALQFNQTGLGNGLGMRLGGSTFHDTSANIFGMIQGVYGNSPAIQLDNSDNNIFQFLILDQSQQSGHRSATYAVICSGNNGTNQSCRSNVFQHVGITPYSGNHAMYFQGTENPSLNTYDPASPGSPNCAGSTANTGGACTYPSTWNVVEYQDDIDGTDIIQGTGSTLNYMTASTMKWTISGPIETQSNSAGVVPNCGALCLFGNFSNGAAESDLMNGLVAATDCFRFYHRTGSSTAAELADLTCAGNLTIFGQGIQLSATTFSALPTCNSGNAGFHAYITDASAAITVWNQTVSAGGGSNKAFITCNGSTWNAYSK